MKKTLSVILSFLLIFSLAAETYAYKLSTAATLRIKPEVIPEGTDYVDLLIPVSKAEKENLYSQKAAQSKLYSIATMGIIEVNENGAINNLTDGFCSFYLHIKNSSIAMPQKTEDGYIELEYNIANGDTREFLSKCKSCKLAFANRDGNILSVTEEFKFNTNGFKDLTLFIMDDETVKVKYQILYNKIVIITCLIAIVIFVTKLIYDKYIRPEKKDSTKTKGKKKAK